METLIYAPWISQNQVLEFHAVADLYKGQEADTGYDNGFPFQWNEQEGKRDKLQL